MTIKAKSDKPLVSIVVPVYNTERFLGECITSIVNQSHKNIELILVDDGSNDGSLALCRQHASRDERITVIAKPNTGRSDSRNVGMVASKGTYVCFVDSDDVVKPDYVATLLDGLVSNDADAAFCNFEYLYGTRRIQKKPRLASGCYTFTELQPRIIDDGTLSGILFGSAWIAIYKRSLIDEHSIAFDPDLSINEDGLFNIEYCMNSSKLAVLSDAYLYEYRQDVDVTKKMVPADNIFADATHAIRSVCAGQMDAETLDRQLRARKVSESLWMILLICKQHNLAAGRQIVAQVRRLLSESTLRSGFDAIDTDAINTYKTVYFWLMKHRMSRSLFLLTRYVFPTLSRVLAR